MDKILIFKIIEEYKLYRKYFILINFLIDFRWNFLKNFLFNSNIKNEFLEKII